MPTYPFEYARATSVDDALALLADHAGEAKLLAGGHSLIPAMKLRLSAPSLLVDVTGLDDLREIASDGEQLKIGALATHRTVEFSSIVKKHCRVLAEAAAQIGDPQVRNHGTIGGSLAHADPAADYPALVLALDASIEITGKGGSRTVAADDFFVGMYTTAVEEGEMITAIQVPVLKGGSRAAYAKFANPASRFAVVGVAVRLEMDGDTCRAARVGVTGAAPSAFRATDVEERLSGQVLTDERIAKTVRGMADPADLMSDLSGSADYRAHLCEVMTRRAIQRALGRS